MKDEYRQIIAGLQIVWDNISRLDKLAGPIPDSIFQGVRSAFRALEDEIESMSIELGIIEEEE